MDRVERFAEYVAAAAREAGYDIDSPRGGGKTELANHTGMSVATVSRMLAGKVLPDPYRLQHLASVLNVPVGQLLVLHGVLSHDPFAPEAIAQPRHMSPKEAADALGIRDPLRVKLFEAMVGVLLADDADEEAP